MKRNTIDITNLESYVKNIRKFKKRLVIYRGISEEREMWPKIVRSFFDSEAYKKFREKKENINGFPHNEVKDLFQYSAWEKTLSIKLKNLFFEYEETLFNSFKRQARAYKIIEPKSDWEWLALGQHRGLPTRLLDWTKNPLFALYFSLQGSFSNKFCYVRYVELGEIGSGHKHMVSSEFTSSCSSPLKYCNPPNRYLPPAIDKRIVSQDAIFSIQRNPLYPIMEDWKSETPSIKCGEFRINRQKIGEDLKNELFSLGIDQVSLFPDINNLCKKLDWVWQRYKHFDAKK